MRTALRGILGAALLLGGCSSQPPEPIVGTWILQGGTRVMELTADGGVAITEAGVNLSGTYSFPDPLSVRFVLREEGGPAHRVTFRVKLREPVLTLTEENQQTWSFRRVSREEAARQMAANSDERVQKARRTLRELQAIAFACENYAASNQAYPVASSFEELAPLLEPTYLRPLPPRDAWGSPYYFRSDASSYQLRSLGSDRTREDDPPAGKVSSFAADIVYVDGALVQWPDLE